MATALGCPVWYARGMRLRSLALACCFLPIAGCAQTRTVYFVGRGEAPSGQTNVTVVPGHPNGDLEVSLGGTDYKGRWVYVAGPGAVALTSTTAVGGGQSATALGTGVAVPTSGTGSIVLSGVAGASVRCLFAYSGWSSTGIGECQDDKGGHYDLQITR